MIFFTTYRKSLITLVICCALVPHFSQAYFWHSWSKKQKTIALVAATQKITIKTAGIVGIAYIYYRMYLMIAKIANMADIANSLQQPSITNTPQVPVVLPPFHAACKEHNEEKLITLLQQQPDQINIPDKDGNTPLMLASLHDFASGITILIEHGANINSDDNTKKSALDIAIELEHYKIGPILIKHGAPFPNYTPDQIKLLEKLTRFNNYPYQSILLYQHHENQIDTAEKRPIKMMDFLFWRSIACNKHYDYIEAKFLQANKTEQKRILKHALLHNTNFFQALKDLKKTSLEPEELNNYLKKKLIKIAQHDAYVTKLRESNKWKDIVICYQ